MHLEFILLYFTYFCMLLKRTPTGIFGLENERDYNQMNRLGECAPENVSDKVVRVTLLLPSSLSLEAKVWTTHNRLALVRPAIELAAREDKTQYQLSKSIDTSYKTFSEILPGWSIQVEAVDSYCDSIAAGLESVRLRCSTDVFLGPVCPYALAPVARYSTIWKIPVLTNSGLGDNFRDKDAYPIISLSGTYQQFASFTEKLLEEYKWKIVSFLYEANHPKDMLGKTMCSFALETVYMKLVGDEGAAGGSAGTNIGTRAIYDTTNATETMQFVKDVSRVVIMCASPHKVREILLAAENLGMLERGEYVFFNVELFTRNNKLFGICYIY